MTQEPLLSLVVPVRGDSEDIFQLEVLAQSEQTHPIEWILVIDGAPSQNTQRVLATLDGRPDVTVARQCAAGPGTARNLGFMHTKGTFVAFVDVDDCADPLAFLGACLELQKSQLDVAALGYREVSVPDNAVLETVRPRPGAQNGWALLRRRAGVWRFVFRTSLLTTADLRFPDAGYGEDLRFLLHVLTSCPNVWGIHQVAYTYRHHTGPQLSEKNPSARELVEVWASLVTALGVNGRSPTARHVLESWLGRIWAIHGTFSLRRFSSPGRFVDSVRVARGIAWSLWWAMCDPQVPLAVIRARHLRRNYAADDPVEDS